MPTLKLHYDGWLALPAGMRHALGLNSGDRLEAELVAGTLVLRPVIKPRRAAPNNAAAGASTVEMFEAHTPEPSAMPAKRKPGRPRKVTTAGGEDSSAPKGRGRPSKVAPARKPDTAALPKVDLGPPRLLKKADLAVKTAAPDTPTPVTRPAARVVRPDRAPQPVERRPFRNVEVRPLGPGRRHNRRAPGDPARQPD